MERAITFRPARAEDASFLSALYASTRAEELALLDWEEQQRAAFLTMQFTAQQRYYRTVYADAECRIILVDDAPVGQMYVEHQPAVIVLMGFAVLTEHRGRGIGTAALRMLLGEAARAGKPVRLHVERTNPARHLYERLGFRWIADEGIHWLMEWAPGPSD
jgi:ribosomal protein S18 acetylase RimI-like enzyme